MQIALVLLGAAVGLLSSFVQSASMLRPTHFHFIIMKINRGDGITTMEPERPQKDLEKDTCEFHLLHVTVNSILDVKMLEMRACLAQRPAPAQRLLPLSLGAVALLVLYLLVCAGNARAQTDELSTAADPTGAGRAGLTGGTLGAVSGADQGSPAPAEAASDAAAASTEQTAASDAAAAQQQPRNIVVVVRIDSSGNGGAVVQTNVAGAESSGSNDGSTIQAGAPAPSGAAAGGQQDASTDQSAESSATATQDQAGNIVISIRINSPGDDGPITQTNTAVADSNAGNTSSTVQGGAPTSAGTDGDMDGSGARDRPDAIGPPAERQAPAPGTSAAATPPAHTGLVPLPAPKKPKRRKALTEAPHGAGATSSAASGPRGGAGASPRRGGAVAQAPGASLAAAPLEQSGPRAAAQPELRHPGPRAKSAHSPAAAHADRAAQQDRSLGRRAADALRWLPPRTPLRADDPSSDVSSDAVVLTLVAVLGALLVFAGSAYLPSGRRLLQRRWRG